MGSVLDAEPEVRCAAYSRLREVGFLLSDVECQKSTMTIIKEGLSDRSMIANSLTGKVTSLKEEFLSFLEPLVFEEHAVKVDERMQQSFEQLKIAVDVGSEIKVPKVLPQRLFELLDLREALVNDYFVKLPFMAIGCLFDLALKQFAAFPEESPLHQLFQTGDSIIGYFAIKQLKSLKQTANVIDAEDSISQNDFKHRLMLCEQLGFFDDVDATSQ